MTSKGPFQSKAFYDSKYTRVFIKVCPLPIRYTEFKKKVPNTHLTEKGIFSEADSSESLCY